MVKQFIKEKLGTIIVLAIAAVFVAWGYFSIQAARKNAVVYKVDYVAPEGNVDSSDDGTYVSVARSDSLELFYNAAKGAIQVKDLESGYLWKGICDNEVYDLDSINKQWANYLRSPITISYNNLKKRDSGARKVYAAKDCNWLEAAEIENGVSVEYGFLTPGIYITIEYVLEDDQLVVRVPENGIREESTYAVTVIELLPYFGASDNSVDGYLLYPDGSGAITTYAKADTRPSNVSFATYYAYTNKNVSITNFYDDAYNRYTAAMPVYGIKNGENALFAAATEGASNTAVLVYASGYVVDLNHIGFELYPRNVYSVDMYSISTGSDSSATGGVVQRVDKELIPETKEVRYFFLHGEEANYSGMASVYREYLLENGMLKKAVTADAEIPLAIRLLMGTTKEGMVFDEYISMTDFDQVQEIMSRLAERGVKDQKVTLRAWMKDYDRYAYWGPARQLGGTGGLKDLNKYAAENPGAEVYLENGFVWASSETKGISMEKDIVYNGLNVEVAVTYYSGLTDYLMNPLAASKRNNAFLSRLKNYDRLGVGYNSLGSIVYPDFNENASYTKEETVAQWQAIMESAAATGRKVASGGANEYVYGQTDYLYAMREESYGLNITDYSIPFLQMVVSGCIPYSTEGAGNLSYDLQTQKLKWVEYGAMPYFFLTYESALKLRDTGYDSLFSSTYDDWEDRVVDTYLEFKENLSCVYGEQMVSHEYLTDDLVRIEYANGIAVYINYGGEETAVKGVSVSAKSYVVVKGGEG